MHMIHLLPSGPPVILDDVQPGRPRRFHHRRAHTPHRQEQFVPDRFVEREKRFRMPFGNDEGMPRKGRVDVQKSQQAIRFVDLRAGQRTLRDPAKKTLVRHNNSCS